MPFIATCVDAIGTVFWDRPMQLCTVQMINREENMSFSRNKVVLIMNPSRDRFTDSI